MESLSILSFAFVISCCCCFCCCGCLIRNPHPQPRVFCAVLGRRTLFAKSLIPILIFQTEHAESTHAHSESCHVSLTSQGCVLLLSNSFHPKSRRNQFFQMEFLQGGNIFKELLLFKQRKFDVKDKRLHVLLELGWS